MNKSIFVLTATAMTVLVALAVSAGLVSAHGGASVAVTPTAAGPGDQVEIKIDGYEGNTLVTITLEGVSGSIPLGTLTTDADGAGTTTLMIPEGVKAGTYSAKAVGGDDNETADFSVNAPAGTDASSTSGSSTMTDNGGGATGGGGFTYEQPTAQWVGIAIAAAIVALMGFALVLRREPRG